MNKIHSYDDDSNNMKGWSRSSCGPSLIFFAALLLRNRNKATGVVDAACGEEMVVK